jgi:tryptophan synthase alpha chain
MRAQINTNIGELIQTVKQVSDIPCAIGFGISNPQQAADMAKLADGVICGSAIVKIVAEHGKQSVAPVADFVRAMKAAVAEV